LQFRSLSRLASSPIGYALLYYAAAAPVTLTCIKRAAAAG
jgi:hypothetical protein